MTKKTLDHNIGFCLWQFIIICTKPFLESEKRYRETGDGRTAAKERLFFCI